MNTFADMVVHAFHKGWVNMWHILVTAYRLLQTWWFVAFYKACIHHGFQICNHMCDPCVVG